VGVSLVGFTYRRDVLSELERHGVKPRPDTPPELVREYVNDLYVYEIRALRRDMRAGLIAKADYAGRVEQLRRRYPLLSLPLRHWTEGG
jgi:hypothetical protein